MDEHFFIYNNKFYLADTPVIGIENRSLMYGDGLFETMRLHGNVLVNKSLHFERFFSGIHCLKYPVSDFYTESFFTQKIKGLLTKNKIDQQAKIRLVAFRKEADLLQNFEGSFHYIIEAWPMEEAALLNKQGLRINVFTDAGKNCDVFSNVKSNNYLVNILAQQFAKENKLDESLLINSFGRICESAIANVYIVKDNVICTPPLSEGCVAGIVRRWLLDNLPLSEFQIIQKKLTLADVHDAEEIFLTNSIKPVRWVETFQDKHFGNEVTKKIASYVFDKMKDE